jgi:hypothetical protein
MLFRFAVLAALVGLSGLPTPAGAGEKSPARHGVTADLKSFPQATPKQALASVLKAIDLKRIDYLLAQLSEPEWVDERVKIYEGGFAELTKETAARLDPPAVKKLARFLKEGEFETLDGTAVVRLKDVKDRVVRLRKIDRRWYLENRYKP